MCRTPFAVTVVPYNEGPRWRVECQNAHCPAGIINPCEAEVMLTTVEFGAVPVGKVAQ
jgi:hypothetical protein